MIDAHCHLDRCADPHAAADPSLAAIVTVGTSLPRSLVAVELATRYPNVYAAIGVHPNEASALFASGVREGLEELVSHECVVAVGETGFDDYWKDETLEAQRAAFDWHAALAAAHDKALVLHVRDAQGSQAASLAAADGVTRAAGLGVRRGVLHCFNAHPALLEAGLGAGWWFSFAGNLTYKSANGLRAAAADLPRDRLVVETDSPYLAPEPLRGKPNVPANVRHTAARLAEVLGVPVTDLELELDANARALYRLAISA